jgi:phage baseplate assembly protein W
MSKKFLGMQYPLVKTPRGLLAQKSNVDQIKADLLQLLLTNPGERVMMPTFGTPLKDLLFEPNDETLETIALNMISESILTWEPRIVVQNISIQAGLDRNDRRLHPDDSQDDLDSILMISIEFLDPENISQIEELVLQVPLQR